MAERPTGTHLVVDGSNIATEGRSLPSLQQLDEAVRALITEQPHDTWTVVVDATFGHRIDSSEKQMYEEALAANELVTPPAGTIGRGDKFLLEIADRANATVFSNDSFQEFHGDYEWLFDEGRLIGGKPVPEVGWIFTARTPVRGPKSRMSSRAASERRGRASGSRGSRRILSATEPLPVPSKPPPRSSRRQPLSAVSVAASTTPAPEAETDEAGTVAGESSRSGRTSRVRRSPSTSVEAVNEPLPFIEFIAEHGPGSAVKGEVTTFTSHGAFVQVGDVRCYLALKLMGDPAPRSARDVLNRGEVYDFVVHALDAPRRGIDLAMPAAGKVGEQAPAGDEELPTEHQRRPRRVRQAPRAGQETDVPAAAVAEPATSRRRRVRTPTPMVEGRDEALVVAKSGADEELTQDAGEGASEMVAPAKKAPTKRAAAKNAATKKAVTKKAAVKKVSTTKATESTAAAKKLAAEAEAEAEKATPTKKAATKKATPTKKAATKKVATTKKAPTKKAPTKKAPTKKAPAKKAPAKKAPAKKATTAKTVGAKKTATKKAPTRKRAAASQEGGPPDESGSGSSF